MTTKEKTIQTRKNFIDLMDGLSLKTLNCLAPGFKNTIAWNFGHILVSQQKLCYIPAGVPAKVSDNYLTLFQKGTQNIRDITQAEIDELKKLSFSLIEEMEVDIKSGYLDQYQPLQTHFGLLLQNIEDAADFSSLHDALHLGYALAQRRALEGTI